MERRHTKHKKEILTLFQSTHLLTPANVQEQLPDLDPSTMYRNIKRFVEDGVLREVPIDGVLYYECADMDEHGHFVCDSCQEVNAVTVSHQTFASYLPNGAIATKVDVTVHGICKKCQNC